MIKKEWKDMGGPSMVEVKDLYYCLALLNSNIAHIVFNLLNPTINLQNKDVKRFPITINSMKKENIENISKETVELKKRLGFV